MGVRFPLLFLLSCFRHQTILNVLNCFILLVNKTFSLKLLFEGKLLDKSNTVTHLRVNTEVVEGWFLGFFRRICWDHIGCVWVNDHLGLLCWARLSLGA